MQRGDCPLHGARLLMRLPNLTAWRRHRLVLHSGDALRWNRRSIDQKRATFLVGATQSAVPGPRTYDAANSVLALLEVARANHCVAETAYKLIVSSKCFPKAGNLINAITIAGGRK